MLASTSSAAATAAIITHTNTNASCARRRNFSSDVQHHQRKRNMNNSEFRRQRRQKRRNNDSTLFVTDAESGGFGDGITNNGLTREISEDVDTVLLDCDGVIWHGDALVPGAKKAVDYLRAVSYTHLTLPTKA